MNVKTVDIEVFSSSVCNRCQRASLMVSALLEEQAFDTITWREINVVEEIDYAVAHAVLSTPTIVIGGTQRFTTLPSEQKLRDAIQDYMSHVRSGNE